jgi:cell division septal protein FtsQ
MSKRAKTRSPEDIQEYDRDPRKVLLKKKKHKRLKRRFRIALYVLIIVAIVVFLAGPASKVESYSYLGNEQIKSSYLNTVLKKYENSFYFHLPTSKMEKALKETPMIKKASVSTDLLGHVKVTIQESEVACYGSVNNKTYILDEAGHVFEKTSDFTFDSLSKYPKMEKFKSVSQLKEFLPQYLKLPDVIKSSISDIIYDETKTEKKQVRLIMDDGKSIIVRWTEMAKALNTKRFNYQAYVNAYSDYCTFTIRANRIIYMEKC